MGELSKALKVKMKHDLYEEITAKEFNVLGRYLHRKFWDFEKGEPSKTFKFADLDEKVRNAYMHYLKLDFPNSNPKEAYCGWTNGEHAGQALSMWSSNKLPDPEKILENMLNPSPLPDMTVEFEKWERMDDPDF